ncbi:prenyltransferase [Leptospira sp. GIMC2001]|uniref:prenyltransferase n=1 Tax=Leptospira sp. GIMC2001 TaxID=1513297 RepID=UPI002349BB7F|nr:prenyltransferase [Leptospira sp. GIMC2001]WCL50906.1 prenyltransferase [Leptospira sp. GIMC2001]
MIDYRNWIFAFKLNSWPKLLIPFLLGQALAYESNENYWKFFIIGLGITIFLTIYIVLLNDYADMRVDGIKRSMFPEYNSLKTIPDKILKPSHVLNVGVVAGIIVLSLSLICFYINHNFWIPILGYLCLSIFFIYSFPPIELNYRGGGELLEMFGVGAFLPLFQMAIQSYYKISEISIVAIVSFLMFSGSSAIASGLSDEQSDIAGGKNTVVTYFGNRKSKILIRILQILGIGFLFPLYFYLQNLWWIVLLIQVHMIYRLWKTIRLENLANTNEFKNLNIFKNHLHLSIWISFGVFSIMIMISRAIL